MSSKMVVVVFVPSLTGVVLWEMHRLQAQNLRKEWLSLKHPPKFQQAIMWRREVSRSPYFTFWTVCDFSICGWKWARQNLRSEKVQNEKSPNLLNFRPDFFPKNAPNFPPCFRDFPFFVSWETKTTENSLKLLAIFNAKSPGKLKEKNHKNVMESRQNNKIAIVPVEGRDIVKTQRADHLALAYFFHLFSAHDMKWPLKVCSFG